MFFVYGDTNPADEKSGYILLGNDIQFSYGKALTDDDEPRRVIQGWVDKRRVCLWRTREAVRWDTKPTRNTPVQAYLTEADAKKAEDGTKVETEVSEVLVEVEKKLQPPAWEDYRMRYPVLPLRQDKDGDVPYFVGDKNNILRRIAVVGDLVDDEGKLLVTGAKMTDIQLKIDRIQKEINTTEIMFVIDDSESMDVWFKPAAAIIQQLVENSQADTQGGTLKIGFTFYSDVPINDRKTEADLRKAIVQVPFASATSEAMQKAIKELANHERRAGYDPREQLFLGLHMALDDPGWSPDARKILIVLGDMGDHDTNPRKDNAAEKAIVEKLAPKGQSPIEFFAIQLNSPNDADGKAFIEQTEKIAELFKAKTDSTRQAGYFAAKDDKKLRESFGSRTEKFCHDGAEKVAALCPQLVSL